MTSWLARTALVLAAALVLAGCAGHVRSLVTVHGNGFTIGLPDAPKVSHETYRTISGDVRALLYTDARPTYAFVASLTAYPVHQQITLDGAVNAVAKSIQGTVRLDRRLTFHGLPAVQARIFGSSGGTEVTIFILVIDVHKKLFQLEYIASGPELRMAPPILTKVAYSISFT
jgi:hypothetical protein